MQIRTILYQHIKTLIKHVFLLNFTYELLMSSRSLIKNVHAFNQASKRQQHSPVHITLNFWYGTENMVQARKRIWVPILPVPFQKLSMFGNISIHCFSEVTSYKRTLLARRGGVKTIPACNAA